MVHHKWTNTGSGMSVNLVLVELNRIRDSRDACNPELTKATEQMLHMDKSGPKNVPRPNRSNVDPERSRPWFCTNTRTFKKRFLSGKHVKNIIKLLLLLI